MYARPALKRARLTPCCSAQAKSLGAEFLTVSLEESGEGTGCEFILRTVVVDTRLHTLKIVPK